MFQVFRGKTIDLWEGIDAIAVSVRRKLFLCAAVSVRN